MGNFTPRSGWRRTEQEQAQRLRAEVFETLKSLPRDSVHAMMIGGDLIVYLKTPDLGVCFTLEFTPFRSASTLAEAYSPFEARVALFSLNVIRSLIRSVGVNATTLRDGFALQVQRAENTAFVTIQPMRRDAELFQMVHGPELVESITTISQEEPEDDIPF